MTALERRWSPVGLALSCVLAAIALCLHADNQLLRFFGQHGASGVFVGAFLAGVVALCAAVLVSAHDEEQRRWSIGLGLATGGAGVVFALFAQVLPASVSAAGSGALLGFGLACLLRQWGRYYRLFSFQGALLNTAVSFLAAACLWLAVAHAGTPFLFCLGLLVLVFCGGLPLLARQIVHAGEDAPAPSSTVEALTKSLATMRQVMRLGWAAVAGLLLNFFTIGLAFWPEAARVEAGGFSPKPLAYGVLVIVVWWVVSRAQKPVGGMLEAFYRTSLPVAATIMLASPFVGAALPLSNSLAFSAVSYAAIATCNVLGLVILFWTAKCSEVGFSKVFAAFCASCAAAVAAGMVVFQLLGDAGQTALSCLLAAYLAAMLLGEARAALLRPRHVLERATESSGEPLAEECE